MEREPSLSNALPEPQSQIASLRIKELQECLERLGMKKTGKKAELRGRLLSIFQDSAAL
jgi:hypothetical protein